MKLEPFVVLVYENPETGEKCQYRVSRESLLEMSVNLSNDELANMALWMAERLAGVKK